MKVYREGRNFSDQFVINKKVTKKEIEITEHVGKVEKKKREKKSQIEEKKGGFAALFMNFFREGSFQFNFLIKKIK